MDLDTIKINDADIYNGKIDNIEDKLNFDNICEDILTLFQQKNQKNQKNQIFEPNYNEIFEPTNVNNINNTELLKDTCTKIIKLIYFNKNNTDYIKFEKNIRLCNDLYKYIYYILPNYNVINLDLTILIELLFINNKKKIEILKFVEENNSSNINTILLNNYFMKEKLFEKNIKCYRKYQKKLKSNEDESNEDELNEDELNEDESQYENIIKKHIIKLLEKIITPLTINTSFEFKNYIVNNYENVFKKIFSKNKKNETKFVLNKPNNSICSNINLSITELIDIIRINLQQLTTEVQTKFNNEKNIQNNEPFNESKRKLDYTLESFFNRLKDEVLNINNIQKTTTNSKCINGKCSIMGGTKRTKSRRKKLTQKKTKPFIKKGKHKSRNRYKSRKQIYKKRKI
jgi:hypothetical protein